MDEKSKTELQDCFFSTIIERRICVLELKLEELERILSPGQTAPNTPEHTSPRLKRISSSKSIAIRPVRVLDQVRKIENTRLCLGKPVEEVLTATGTAIWDVLREILLTWETTRPRRRSRSEPPPTRQVKRVLFDRLVKSREKYSNEKGLIVGVGPIGLQRGIERLGDAVFLLKKASLEGNLKDELGDTPEKIQKNVDVLMSLCDLVQTTIESIDKRGRIINQ